MSDEKFGLHTNIVSATFNYKTYSETSFTLSLSHAQIKAIVEILEPTIEALEIMGNRMR